MNFIRLENDFNRNKRQPASYVRHCFQIGRPVRSANLKITALGVYIGYLNGQRLTDEELLPGYTDYRFRVQVQSYDVADRLREGENVIAALVGDGWYRGALGAGSTRNGYGDAVMLAFQLKLTYADGTEETVEAGEGTKTTQGGALRENDLKLGEVYDARMEMPGWNAPAFDDSTWHGVSPSSYGGTPIPHEGVPIRKLERFTPAVLHTANGGTVLDFGQNFSGRVAFCLSGRAGHTVKLTMGETLDADGNFTLENLHIKGTGKHVGSELQALTYICKDGQQTYEPIFLICGFRYVLVENWPEEVKPENFCAYAVYSQLRQTGSFSCNDPLINRLVQNVRWSQKSNFVDIPTDCPTRERVGWTADISVFAETACYLTDVKQFLMKWLRDYMAEQQTDGNLPFTVPTPDGSNPTWGCMGWSNAISNVVMTLYRFYGDVGILEMVYDSVRKFADFNVRRAKARNPKALFLSSKNRDYVIETGFHFGEWLEPGSNMVKDYIKAMVCPDTEVTIAWFYQTAAQLAEMAKILGKKEDATEYGRLTEKLKKVYRERFLKSGAVHGSRQCRYVRPLSMGLLEKGEQEANAERLAELCAKNRYHVGTGFLTTWQVLNVLADHGQLDAAYKLLENKEYPGWLYTVTKGATTTWENWNGIDEENRPTDSLNHYAMGSVVAWLFSHCAGIQPLRPGFEEILIVPQPGGCLTHAEAEYESPAGRIAVEWSILDGMFLLHVECPTDKKVRIILPDGSVDNRMGGTSDYQIPFGSAPWSAHLNSTNAKQNAAARLSNPNIDVE